MISFRIVVLAAAVFGYQVNAQIGGFIRPFTTGFTNGFAEVAKPFVQIMSPGSEYMPGQRFPYVPQMMTYPSKIVPQTQANVYEGFDTATSGVPGASYFQAVRPPVMKPQTQFYPIQPAFMRPIRPLPAAVDESVEIHRPSNLLIKPEPEAPKSEEKLDAGFEGPSAQISKQKE